MSVNLTLNCWVSGENPHDKVFPIVVNTSEVNTVGRLKDLIKEKQSRTFANVDSREMKLWKVDIPLNNISTVDTKLSVNDKDKRLSPLDEISEIFANQPPQKHIHLYIEREREFGANQTEFRASLTEFGANLIEYGPSQDDPSVYIRFLHVNVYFSRASCS